MVMLCPICAGEFHSPGIDCPTCGCTLIPETMSSEPLVATRRNPVEQIQFVELCRPRIYPIALLIKQTLEQHGIHVLVHGGNAASLMPQLAFGGELRVMVDREQYEFAREVYKSYFDNDENLDYIMESESR